MSKDKEEMIVMLAEKYDQIIRNTEKEDAKEEGEDKLSVLIQCIIQDGKPIDDVKKVTEDKVYRQKMYIQYGIK